MRSSESNRRSRRARRRSASRCRRRSSATARSSPPAQSSSPARGSARACGSLIENDTSVGALTKIQADAYITAYSTLEENVFIAPCVVTTNDNFMGRTEKRRELVKGPTIRRGARVGGGAVLLPAVEIGEEAFVGAGAVVTKDVPPRKLVVGSPARVLREVSAEELLENQ
jgi:acetyltransferase-like isoleucine patch superfamily enzyme